MGWKCLAAKGGDGRAETKICNLVQALGDLAHASNCMAAASASNYRLR